jgi:NAD(P)-dependent dehydrogenase (short-subunit alcohol dehydrogenase family)
MSHMDLGLTGSRAVITGGSRGIGRVIAETLVAEGGQVAICGRQQATLDEALGALGDAAIGTALDVGDHDDLAAWVESSAAAMGGLDIVISNASALGGIPRNPEGWRKNFDIDVLSTVALVDAATPHLESSGMGSIVQIGTITAVEYHGFPGGGYSYGAMKAAVINYMSQLSIELAPQQIRANTVSPGPIFIANGSWGWIEKNMPEYFEENVSHQPQGRFGTAQEVANVVAFLASPAASWVTGENVVVDGGFTRRVAF